MDNENTAHNFRWLAQAISGILLVLLLSIHLLVNHRAAPLGLLTYADIVSYYDIPGVAIMEALFLIIVTFHCFLGLRSILLDLNLQPLTMRVLNQSLIVIGFATIIYGIYLITKVI